MKQFTYNRYNVNMFIAGYPGKNDNCVYRMNRDINDKLVVGLFVLNIGGRYCKMTKQILIILLFTLSIESWAQIDYDKIRRKKFYSPQFDTTSTDILRLEKKHAIIYFKKSDIKELINNPVSRDPKFALPGEVYADLETLLNSSEQIQLTDWWYDYTDDDRKKMFGFRDYENEDKKYVDNLYYLCPDLLHDSKAMIVEKETGKVIKDKMIIKRVHRLMGTEYLDFLLPNKKSIWNLVLVLGE